MLFVFGVLALTVILFASDRLRLDVVALLALLALLLGGILTPAEALAGFSDPIVLIIAGLFIVGAGLFQTGVADALGRQLMRFAGAGEARLIAAIMLIVAFLSAFLSSTGTVAVFLPVAVSLAQRAGVSPAKLLLPLAYGSLIGGMLTLIGTPPNIVVSNQLQAAGLPPFGFFSFTPIGVVMLAIGIGYMITVGRHLLPARATFRRRRKMANRRSTPPPCWHCTTSPANWRACRSNRRRRWSVRRWRRRACAPVIASMWSMSSRTLAGV